jgi:hypothetical protein
MAFKDLMDSMAPRTRKFSASKSTDLKKDDRVLLVTDIAFFVERDPDGKMADPGKPDTWIFSEDLRDAVLAKYGCVLVATTSDHRQFLETGFGETDKVEYILVSPSSVLASTAAVIEKLQERCSVRMTLPKNKRTVSWLNLSRFVSDSRVDFADASSHSTLGFEVPKTKTFMDYAKERSRNGWI